MSREGSSTGSFECECFQLIRFVFCIGKTVSVCLGWLAPSRAAERCFADGGASKMLPQIEQKTTSPRPSCPTMLSAATPVTVACSGSSPLSSVSQVHMISQAALPVRHIARRCCLSKNVLGVLALSLHCHLVERLACRTMMVGEVARSILHLLVALSLCYTELSAKSSKSMTEVDLDRVNDSVQA